MRSTAGSAPAQSDTDWFDDTRPSVTVRYKRARRHSAFVRIFKFALPILSLLGVGGFLAYTYLVPQLPAGLSFGSIDVNHNAIVMQQPHVSGFTNDGRAYELKADRAEQSLQNTKVVTLEKIAATIGIGSNDTARIDAAVGVYDADQQRLSLDRKIAFTTTTGISGDLQSADIFLKAGTMKSDKPIEFRSQGSRIQAQNVEVQDRGKHILFRNGVKVTYAAPDQSSATNPPAGSPSVTQ